MSDEPARATPTRISGIGATRPGPRVVLTFGVFDGVHLGQQAIVDRVVERASALNVASAVVVFRPRPVDTLGIRSPRPYLTAQDETVRRIRARGVTRVGVLRFTHELADTPAPRFIAGLMTRVPFQELWLGAEATVGRGSEGSLDALVRLGRDLQFELRTFEGEALPTMRDLDDTLADGDVRGLARYLGRAYELPAFLMQREVDPVDGFARYAIASPEMLRVPPDGHYAVRIRPAAYGGIGRNPAPTRAAIAIVRTRRLSDARPAIGLIVPAPHDMLGEFVRIEFLEVFTPDTVDLAAWSERIALAPTNDQRSSAGD